jgi:hypothetical protein
MAMQQSYTVPMQAAYIQTDSVVKAGTVAARVTFTPSYDWFRRCLLPVAVAHEPWRSRSEMAAPSRSPLLTWSCLTHASSVWLIQPIIGAMGSTAAHRDPPRQMPLTSRPPVDWNSVSIARRPKVVLTSSTRDQIGSENIDWVRVDHAKLPVA